MENIEVEIRSFVSEEKYSELLEFFRENAKAINEDYQESYYFDAKEDLRIQRSNLYSKIWLKRGKIHDEAREELEIKFDRNEFEKIERLFSLLGFSVQIKWFRKRFEFDWDGIKVSLDDTKGYGRIIELEKLCSENEGEKVLESLKQKLAELKVQLTPREEFDKKFQYYKENWRSLILN